MRRRVREALSNDPILPDTWYNSRRAEAALARAAHSSAAFGDEDYEDRDLQPNELEFGGNSDSDDGENGQYELPADWDSSDEVGVQVPCENVFDLTFSYFGPGAAFQDQAAVLAASEVEEGEAELEEGEEEADLPEDVAWQQPLESQAEADQEEAGEDGYNVWV